MKKPTVVELSGTHARITIGYRPVAAIKLDPRNPRKHSKLQIRQIARSIQAFGFNVPVLIDAHDYLIAGHGRVLACPEIGLTEVPTICLEHLSEAQARAFMIADNRLTENATWDDRLLAEQLKALSLVELDFSLEITGFAMAEIDLRIEGLAAGGGGAADPADDVPSIVDQPVVSQLRDIWSLGPHRVTCGNALDDAAYSRVLKGERAAMVFADPPYNVPISGHVSGKGAIKHREFPMASGEMTSAEFTIFLRDVCTKLTAHSVDGAIHFVCMDWRHLPELLAAGGCTYAELKNLCVWVKHNAGMGSLYRSQHELVLVFKNGTAAHINNVQLGEFGRHRSNVWRYAGINSFARATDEGNLLQLHPTVKPVAMIVDALYDCSNRGGIVLDPFLGSGSTLVAAERTGRVCCGIELDPLYVDTAIRRWQRLTGLRARHAESKRDFDELQAEAEDSHVN